MLVLAACGGLKPQADDASYEQVNKQSTAPYVPSTARGLKYYSDAFQDRYEYFYFRDGRESIDGFAVRLLGRPAGVAGYRMNARNELPDQPWWRGASDPNVRGGRENKDGQGFREVAILDHDGYSEIWVSKSGSN